MTREDAIAGSINKFVSIIDDIEGNDEYDYFDFVDDFSICCTMCSKFRKNHEMIIDPCEMCPAYEKYNCSCYELDWWPNEDNADEYAEMTAKEMIKLCERVIAELKDLL